MKNQDTLAFVNMFAVLGDLEILCGLDDEAKKRASPAKPISVSINVGGGPKATFSFSNGSCTQRAGLGGQIKLRLSSPEAFNLMVDGKKNPLPYGGFTKLNFLLKDFAKLTDLLGKYLRADAEALRDRAFFEKSTTMMFYLVVHALCEIANHDDLGQISASRIPDGSIAMEIAGGPCAEIVAKGGHLAAFNRKAENPRAYMIFADYETARGLFDGTTEAMGALASGKIVMKGFIPMIENLNKVLGRVGAYLA